MKILGKIKRFIKEADYYYRLQSTRGIRREKDEIDDFFMLICISELYGIENPYAYYTLEMLPSLMPEFHRWHQKIGMRTSVFDNFPCNCCCC